MYLPVFAKRYGIGLDLLYTTLQALPLEVLPVAFYAHKLSEAAELIGKRNPKDVDLAALALFLGVPVWSNDNDFKGFPTGMYTTAQLLRMLEG